MEAAYVGAKEGLQAMLMQTHQARLHSLREELARRQLDGFVVPISDEHLSEYVGAYAQRLAWLTGFGGSAGSAVVLKEAGEGPGAAMFVDGRYTIQVRDQVDGRLYEYRSVPKEPMGEWIAANAAAGARIGFDPWLHTRGWAQGIEKQLAKAGIELVAVDSNPIDAVWADQPRRDCRLAEGREARHRHHQRARFGGVDAQYPRQRRGPHAGGAILSDGAGRWHGGLVHRARKGARCGCRQAGQCGAHPPA
jgi:hypothetical protein